MSGSSRPALAVALAVLASLIGACDGGVSTDVDAAADGAAPVDQRPATPRTCPPPPGVSARPRTIAETVALVNALPRPVSVACFLESLERPLYLNATRSFISLQPAQGAKSPRMFLMFEGMSISVVPEGTGSKLIEFGEFVTPDRTLKAEIKTPVTAEVQPGDPYRSPINTTGANAGVSTVCRTCHALEERWEPISYADAYASTALRPDPRLDVTLTTIQEQRDACPDEDQSERCVFFRALLDHGPVLHRPFPETLPTIFD